MMSYLYQRLRSVAFLRLLVCTCAVLGSGAGAAQAARTVISMNEDWRFQLGEVPNAVAPEYDDSKWRKLDVPHDYVVEGKFSKTNPYIYPGMNTGWYSQHAFLPVQPSVYRKTFSLPAGSEGKQVWLEFDGVCSNSRYWLNGMDVGSEYSVYNRSRYDITEAVNYKGQNVLVVQVDPRYDGWWYEGGGIYRHVRMVILDPVHVAPDGVYVVPHMDDTGDGERANATVSVQTDVSNKSDADIEATVLSEVIDCKGKVVASDSSLRSVRMGESLKFTQDIRLLNASLWSPDSPNLYKLRSTVLLSGKIVDQLTTNFGVREARFDAKNGFFLNGKRLQIQGINMHQDHAGVGVAMPDRLFTWRLERLKEIGCNAIRMSHNPVTPFLMDECDRMGFLVIAENRHFGDTYEDQTSRDTPAVEHRDLTSLIMRDRNHPSVILWSLCNEQWIQGTPEAGVRAEVMRQHVRKLDPSRPVTAAMNGGFDSPDGMISSLDVVGINYHPEVYDMVHEMFPDLPIVASEIASEEGTRGVYSMGRWEHYYGDREAGYLAAYSINAGVAGQVVEDAWPPIVARPNIAGGFVWAAFDYKGEPRPFDWPVINCHYGFMDICGFPKDSYYYYKSWWTDEPVLHLFPHWNWAGREGEEIPVWVHSNCDSVELFLNGVSLGEKQVKPLHHLEWNVKYAPGKLEARGKFKGKSIESIRETTGKPAAVRISADRSALNADNVDLSVIKVEIVDSQGRVVPVAENMVNFTIKGPGKIIGVGNGDPSSHEPDKADRRSAFNGLAQVIVQTTHQPGTIELKADSSGLKSSTIRISSSRASK